MQNSLNKKCNGNANQCKIWQKKKEYCALILGKNMHADLMLSFGAGLTSRNDPAALTQPQSHKSLLEEGLEIQLCVFCLSARKYYPFN